MRKRVNSRKLPLVLLLVHSQKQNLKLWSFENRWTEQPCNLIQSNPSTSQEKTIHWTLENYSKPQRKKRYTYRKSRVTLPRSSSRDEARNLMLRERRFELRRKHKSSSQNSHPPCLLPSLLNTSSTSSSFCFTQINRQIIAYKRARETFVGYLHIMGQF